MRNLYLALGFRGVVNDHDEITQAVRKKGISKRVEEEVLSVLLQPARKSRYDWALEKALELAEARLQLGLPPLAHFQMPEAWTRPAGRESRTRPPEPLRTGTEGLVPSLLAVAIAICLGVVLFLHSNSRDVAVPKLPPKAPKVETSNWDDRVSDQPVDHSSSQPKVEPRDVPPPIHGWLQGTPGLVLRVPWRIETDPGQGYLLTLLDAKSKAVVLTLYLQGGEPFLGQAPEGEFELAYSSGTQWFGLSKGFGPESRVIRSEQIHLVLSGPDDTWVWELQLHPTNGERPRVEPVRPTLAPSEK